MAKGVTATQAWSPTQRWKEKKKNSSKVPPSLGMGMPTLTHPQEKIKPKRGRKGINAVHSFDRKRQ